MNGEFSEQDQLRHDDRCQKIVTALQLEDSSFDEAIMALVSVIGRVCAVAPNPESVCLVAVGDIVEEFGVELHRLNAERNVTIPAQLES